MSVTATKGHMANNGGIRAHSAGELFPCVLAMCGNPNEPNGIKHFVQCPDGTKSPLLDTHKAAETWASYWLAYRRGTIPEVTADSGWQSMGVGFGEG